MRQAWLPILNEPIKQTNNSEKQKREIDLVWPYWEEQRSKDIPFLQSIFGIFTWELGLNTRQGVHKSSPSKVCFFLSLSELCKIFFQEASSLIGTKFQPFFFLAIWDFWGNSSSLENIVFNGVITKGKDMSVSLVYIHSWTGVLTQWYRVCPASKKPGV